MTKGKLFVLASALTLLAIPLGAQEQPGVVLRSSAHARTEPLNSFVALLHAKPHPAKPVFPLRHPNPLRGGGGGGGTGGGTGPFTDPDVQAVGTYGSSHFTAPFVFQGIPFNGAIPPDPNLSVGATQVVQIVNVEYDVFNKSTGAEVLAGGAAPISTIFAALGTNDLCAITDGGDPIALYDKLDNRWIISQLAYNSNLFGVPFDFHFCVAISDTSDATGAYNVYDIPFGQSTLPDYPKLAVWSDGGPHDGVYFSANMYSITGTFIVKSSFTGARACMFPRGSVQVPPAALTFTCSAGGNKGVYNILPADLEGATAAPTGTAEYYLQFLSSSGVGNTLQLYQFNNGSFSAVAKLPVGAYHEACGGGTCIPQSGTTQLLDSIGDRLMYRLSYRNYGAGGQQMVVNHSVQLSSATTQTGIRWYRLCNSGAGFGVCQQSTFAPDASLYRWLGSIGQDHGGNLAMGYSTSSSTTYPGVAFTGRLAGTAGMELEQTLFPGQGFQNIYSRWGDYSAISLDTDDCTFWYTNEYMPPGNILGLDIIWQTVIGSFKFTSGCP